MSGSDACSRLRHSLPVAVSHQRIMRAMISLFTFRTGTRFPSATVLLSMASYLFCVCMIGSKHDGCNCSMRWLLRRHRLTQCRMKDGRRKDRCMIVKEERSQCYDCCILAIGVAGMNFTQVAYMREMLANGCLTSCCSGFRIENFFNRRVFPRSWSGIKDECWKRH